MKIILKQDVKSLGYKDDVLVVKNGYANNFLLPKGMAVLATDSQLKDLAENIKQAQFKQDKLKANAEKLAESLVDLTVSVGAKAGANGKIFGSVTSLQVAQALKNKGFDIDRRKIVLDNDIKMLGTHTATLNLFKGIHVPITVEVVSE
jgi:large subunit ribosomal protein L9